MDDIDQILLDYHIWSQTSHLPLGYGSADPTCRDFRTSRQWMTLDELGEEVDSKLRAQVGRLVEPIVMKLGVRERIAVNTACRNFEAGFAIWRNPIAGADQETDYERAKLQIRPKLYAVGLLRQVA